jgi:hypothetical protein
MDFKDDWPQAQERYRAWWAGECLDRPAIKVTAPRKRPLPGSREPYPPKDWLDHRTNADYIIAHHDHAFHHTYYAGEAFPSIWLNLGPGIMAAYYGSPAYCDANTVWFPRIIEDWDSFELRFDADSWWWRRTVEMTRAYVDYARGRCLVGITDLGGCSDIVASLRGNDRLLVDLIENPEPVERAIMQIARDWVRCYDELQAITDRGQQGTTQWLGVWSPGKMYNVQSDFCCMISPAMFERFIVPELELLCAHLDDITYHLDGPGAIKHWPRIMRVPNMGGIQWTPGAGQPNAAGWLPMLKEMQRAGAVLHLMAGAGDVEAILAELSPRGVLIDVGGVGSEEDADDLLRKAAQWSSDRGR